MSACLEDGVKETSLPRHGSVPHDVAKPQTATTFPPPWTLPGLSYHFPTRYFFSTSAVELILTSCARQISHHARFFVKTLFDEPQKLSQEPRAYDEDLTRLSVLILMLTVSPRPSRNDVLDEQEIQNPHSRILGRPYANSHDTNDLRTMYLGVS